MASVRSVSSLKSLYPQTEVGAPRPTPQTSAVKDASSASRSRRPGLLHQAGKLATAALAVLAPTAAAAPSRRATGVCGLSYPRENVFLSAVKTSASGGRAPSVWHVDAASGHMLTTLGAVGHRVNDLAFTPDGRRLWLATDATTTPLVAIDTVPGDRQFGKQVAHVAPSACGVSKLTTRKVAVSPANDYAFVADSAHIAVLNLLPGDAHENKVVTSICTQGLSDASPAFNYGGTELWWPGVTSKGSPLIYVIDTAAGSLQFAQVIAKIPLRQGFVPHAIAFGQDGARVFVIDIAGDHLAAFDAQARVSLGEVAGGGGGTQPFDLATAADGHVYVATGSPEAMRVFNGTTLALSGARLYSNEGFGHLMALAPDGKHIVLTGLAIGEPVLELDTSVLPPVRSNKIRVPSDTTVSKPVYQPGADTVFNAIHARINALFASHALNSGDARHLSKLATTAQMVADRGDRSSACTALGDFSDAVTQLQTAGTLKAPAAKQLLDSARYLGTLV
jgi:DNA-binding beta-propeller fold protein YncE